MIEWISNTIFTTSVFFSMWLYWIPLAIGLVGHVFDIIKYTRQDLLRCEEKWYNPQVTYGWLLGRALVALVPWINILNAVSYFGTILSPIAKLFDAPLVRHKFIPPSGEEKSSGSWREY